MLATVMAADPFIQAVDDARRELERQTGREVKPAELARLSGVKRSTLYYHLDTDRLRPNGHRVPREIVAALAAVLPISEDELMRAAQVAAGYQVHGDREERTDYSFEVARYLDSDDVTEADKAELAARLTQILAEHWNRDVAARRDTQ